MSIVRSPRPESNFSIFANKVIRDTRLSYKARGILLELLSRPNNWRVSADMLAKDSKEGRTAILSGLQELRDLGYIVTQRTQLENGQFETISMVYDLPYISPESGFPTSGEPTSGYPTSGNPTPIEETIKKKREEKTGEPNGLQQLVKLYFDNFVGEIPPSGGQVAGQLKVALKKVSFERLLELVPIVAAEGKALTINTLGYIANRQVEKKVEATPTPPPFIAPDSSSKVLMPEDVRALRESLKKGFKSPDEVI